MNNSASGYLTRIAIGFSFAYLSSLLNSVNAQSSPEYVSFGGGSYEFSRVSEVVVNKQGEYFVLESRSDEVRKISPNGEISVILDSTGDGKGNFLDSPNSLGLDNIGNLYVSGRESNNVFRVATNGQITQILDESGNGTGATLDWPSSIATDPWGNVYVVGSRSVNVFKITHDGVVTEIINTEGDGNGNELKTPYEIAVDVWGNVFVTGFHSNNAFKITLNGEIIQIIDSDGDRNGNELDLATGIAVDAFGNVYVGGWWTHGVFSITPEGVITKIIDDSGDGTGSASIRSAPICFGHLDVEGCIITEGNPVYQATQVKVDPIGNIYLLGRLSRNAFKITPGGQIAKIIDTSGDGLGNEFGIPEKMFIDANGNVFIVESKLDGVFKIAPEIPLPQAEPAYYSDGVLQIPVILVDDIFYSLEMSLTGEDPIEFRVDDVKVLNNPNTHHLSIYNTGIVSIPSVSVGDLNYQVELELVAENPYRLLLNFANDL